MRRVLFSLCIFALFAIPTLSHGNAPVPAPLWYVRLADKAAKPDDNAPAPEKFVRFVEDVPVSLVYRHDVDRPKLIIPQKFVVLDGKRKVEAEPAAPRGIFVGLALSAAFVSGGFWLVRRSGKLGAATLTTSIAVGMVLTPMFLTDVIGNTPPPGFFRPKTLETKDDTATLGMHVFIVEDGDHIQLVLPKRLLPATMIPRDEFFKKHVDPIAELIKAAEAELKKEKK